MAHRGRPPKHQSMSVGSHSNSDSNPSKDDTSSEMEEENPRFQHVVHHRSLDDFFVPSKDSGLFLSSNDENSKPDDANKVQDEDASIATEKSETPLPNWAHKIAGHTNKGHEKKDIPGPSAKEDIDMEGFLNVKSRRKSLQKSSPPSVIATHNQFQSIDPLPDQADNASDILDMVGGRRTLQGVT